MHVTPEGKAIFDEAMARAKKDVVRIILADMNGQGASLRMDLISKEDSPRAEEIDGVLFDLDDGAKEYLAEAIFDAEGNNLKVIARPRGCGCGCGHHHHDGEGCCHHDGEECDCDDCDCGGEGCCHDGEHHHHKA